MSQRHALKWGALDFAPTAPAAAGYLIESVADGTAFGNPEARVESVRSLLTDGSLAILEGWDNREVTIRLRLSSPAAVAGPALAAAESALMAELLATSKSPLVYTPPATDAATCVFDVVGATLERDYADDFDLEEEQREYRYYSLTLTCLPFARAKDKVVVPALPPEPPSPTVVTIDDCNSTTGWSGLDGTTITAGAGSVIGTAQPDWDAVVVRTGAVSMTGATPYLRVQVTATTTASLRLPRFQIDASPTNLPIVSVGEPADGNGKVYYLQPPPSFSKLKITVEKQIDPGLGSVVEVHDVARTNSIGGTRQTSRSATVAGSAPTQAAIRLFDATPGPLGSDILVYTSGNNSWRPALRAYRVSSAAETADSAMVSGKRNTLTSAMTFKIPANLLSEGTYSLLARLNVSTAGPLGWSVRMVSSSGSTTVGSSVVLSGTTTVGTTGGNYQVVNLASIPLPVVKAEANQAVELTLTGTANMTIDEGWLFGTHDGVLTWLSDTDSLSWIEIRSPALGASRPSVYGGTGAKGANSVCIDWKCKSFGTHRFEPGLMQIFTVASTSLASQSEIEFYPRYHSHVA